MVDGIYDYGAEEGVLDVGGVEELGRCEGGEIPESFSRSLMFCSRG